MKTLKIFSTLCLMVIFSCSKDTELQTEMSAKQMEAVMTKTTEDCDLFDDFDKFIDSFGFTAGWMNEDEAIILGYNFDEASWQMCYVMGYTYNQRLMSDPICQGSGMGFINCVRRWLDQNEGQCLIITQQGGNYYAYEALCP